MAFTFVGFLKKEFLWTALFCCLLLSCQASLKRIDKNLVKTPLAEGSWSLQTQGNATSSTLNEQPIQLELNFHYQHDEKQPSYQLLLSHFSPRGQGVFQKGDQLTILLDKKVKLSLTCCRVYSHFPQTLNTKGFSNATHPRHPPFLKGGRKVTQKDFSPGSYGTAYFAVNSSLIKNILKARSLHFSMDKPLEGNKLRGNFNKKNFNLLAQFNLEINKGVAQ